MANYVRYQLGEGLELLVETDGPAGGIAKASVGDAIVDAKQKFEDALEGIKYSAILMRRKLEDLRSDEVDVRFGLKTTGELGNFAVGKVGVEVNYEVTLKWSRPRRATGRRSSQAALGSLH